MGYLQYKSLLNANTPTPILLDVLKEHGLDEFGSDLLSEFEGVHRDYIEDLREREKEKREIEEETRKAKSKARSMG